MKTTIAAMILLSITSYSTAFSADKNKTIEMTFEQRQKMATAHENMATCLRSDKKIEDCRKEMMQSCQETMGKDGCPMMGKMHGMMGKGMMKKQAE